jgi:16S rRNA (adenine1518-N6/adenine1519-N6)-dimethyltransferase
VTRAAFGQRRKMLRSSLKSIGIDPSDAGIDPQLRAEQLTIEQFCALTHLIKDPV